MATRPNFPSPVIPPIVTEQQAPALAPPVHPQRSLAQFLSLAPTLVSTTPASLLGSIQPVLVHETGGKN